VTGPDDRVDEDAVTRARKLVDDGDTGIEKHGYPARQLAVGPDASEETTGRWTFPDGVRPAAGFRREPARGGGQGVRPPAAVEKAFDELLQHLDDTLGS
jgi:hypothetical protein